jgi:16S rRNA (guanine966-N2)-methyltransferase
MSALGGTLDGLEVVDLFAGSGALGLEALSRGAEHVTFVERAHSALRVLRANVALLDAAASCTIAAQDVHRYLKRVAAGAFDVALADPPYGTGDAHRLLSAFADTPFAKELWLEHRWREDLPLPPSARTRRYGDTALTTVPAPT